MNEKALQLIHDALRPHMRIGSGVDLSRLRLMVCPLSDIAKRDYVNTEYGRLRIWPAEYVPKGFAYIIEDPGRIGRVFAWVRRKSNNQNEVLTNEQTRSC
ncbi:hypothetical protein [Paenibacillus sp. HJGM_3]|uniref:hypothetical protein n=1 Tax=Paenibacillus sp. HJGM_3 TaxID=3379816 RepID=UPI00385D1CC4